MSPTPDEAPIPSVVLLSDDSPLRRLPSALQRRQALALDGISFSIDMTLLAYRQLRAALWAQSKSAGQPTRRPVVLHAVTNAWAIVDNVHRLGILVRKLPGLKRGPAVTALCKATSQVEPLRHAVQHLDGEIEGLLADGRPCNTTTPLRDHDRANTQQRLAAGRSFAPDSAAVGPPGPRDRCC